MVLATKRGNVCLIDSRSTRSHNAVRMQRSTAHTKNMLRECRIARLKSPSQPLRKSPRVIRVMPPRSKQAARRANAKASAKGAGKGCTPLDENAERANFERLCPLQRGRIQELAARMAGSFETTPDQMLPSAVRASRELPELLNNAAGASKVVVEYDLNGVKKTAPHRLD